MRDIRQPQIIAGRVNADGSIAAAGGDFTVTRSSLGLYVVTVPFRLVALTANMVYGGTNGFIELDTITERSVRVNVLNGGGTALIDAAFMFIATGVQQ